MVIERLSGFDNDQGTDPNSVVEVDNIGVEHPNAAEAHELSDGVRFVGAMNRIFTRTKCKRSLAHWVARSWWDHSWQPWLRTLHLAWR